MRIGSKLPFMSQTGRANRIFTELSSDVSVSEQEFQRLCSVRIYSSGPGGRAEDGFFVGKGYKDDSYHDVYSFDGANPFYLLPDATENYTTISNGKVYVVQRPGDAGSVYDDAFWEEAHYQFVVTDKLFENGTPL